MESANLETEWGVVSAAPFLSIATVVAIVGVVWLVIHFLYRHRLEGLKRDLESEQAETARLRGQVGEYQQKAGGTPDEVRTKIEVLEGRLAALAPRRLSGEQKRALTLAVAASADEITIASLEGSSDGARYRRDFCEAFAAAGWQINDMTVHGQVAGASALKLIIHQTGPSSDAIVRGMEAAKVEFRLERGGHFGPPCAATILISDSE